MRLTRNPNPFPWRPDEAEWRRDDAPGMGREPVTHRLEISLKRYGLRPARRYPLVSARKDRPQAGVVRAHASGLEYV